MTCLCSLVYLASILLHYEKGGSGIYLYTCTCSVMRATGFPLQFKWVLKMDKRRDAYN